MAGNSRFLPAVGMTKQLRALFSRVPLGCRFGSSCGCNQESGVILSGAAFQAERRISRGADAIHARFLGPLVKTRSFGMTHSFRGATARGTAVLLRAKRIDR